MRCLCVADELYEVETLLDVRRVKLGEVRKREFLVRWRGYSEDDDEWVKEEDLSLKYDAYNCSDTVVKKMTSLFKKL